jgi:hypothetical protein
MKASGLRKRFQHGGQADRSSVQGARLLFLQSMLIRGESMLISALVHVEHETKCSSDVVVLGTRDLSLAARATYMLSVFQPSARRKRRKSCWSKVRW